MTDVPVTTFGMIGATLVQQISTYRNGHAVAVVGVDEAEKNQMTEQQSPMWSEPGQQTVPVEVPPAAPDQMVHVGAVETLAFHDVRFLPDHLLRRNEQTLHSQYFCFNRMLEPEVVNGTDAVTGAEYDVHKIIAMENLAEPVRERHFRSVASPGGRVEGRMCVGRPHEHVEVLGVADDELA